MSQIARFEWQLRHSGNLQAGERPRIARRIIFAVAVSLLSGWLIYHHLVGPDWIAQLPPLLNELLNLFESAAALTTVIFLAIAFWRAQRRRRLAAGSITTNDLYALSPGAFERYVADLFRKKGYKVTMRGRSGDHGVDLELEQVDSRRAIVQCKRYRNAIGPDIVRELFGTMIHEGVHHAFLVTTAEISPAARDWARNKPMTLIDGKALVQIAESLTRSASN